MHPPVRILYICHDGDLYGSQQSLNLIVKHLPSPDYQAFVSVARPGPLCRLLEQYPNTSVREHRRLQWVKHDPRTPTQRIVDVLNLLLLALPRTWRLFNTIRREKINVVHTNSTVSLEGALAAAMAGIPHVWHIRELFMQPGPKFHMVLGRRLGRWIIDRFSDQVVCISHVVRNQFGEYAERDPDKYAVIYNAMELPAREDLTPLNDPQNAILRSLSLRALNLPDHKHVFRIGYIGRISEGKRLHELLEAVAMLRRRDLKVELLVAGNFVDEEYKQRIRQQITDEGLFQHVFLLGYQSKLDEVYYSIDVLVVPSLNEPFGRVVIEAMAHGVPCVAADSGGIPEIIQQGETGVLYPPGDAAALAGILEELSIAFWKLEALRQNARRMVGERFNIEAQIRQLDACYRSILTRHQF